MPAFRRRTLFAAPLIITVATGCKDEQRTSNPPPPVISKNPPAPGESFAQEWNVRRVGVGKCAAEVPFTCPPDTRCNPPEPRAIQCPPGTSGKTVIRVVALQDDTCGIAPKGCETARCVRYKTPCPLPPGQRLPDKLAEVWLVEKNKTDDGCHAEEPPVDCPPGVDCNPPSPFKIDCPPGVTDKTSVKVGMLPDKTCAIVPDGCTEPSCVTTKVSCPKGL